MSEELKNGITLSDFSTQVIPLLKEFTTKFGAIAHEAREIKSKLVQLQRGENLAHDIQQLKTQLNYLVPPTTDLARVVSGMIVNGKLNQLERIELKIRLAEFESAMQGAQTQVDQLFRKR